LLLNFIFCHSGMFFMNLVLKFKYHPSHIKVIYSNYQLCLNMYEGEIINFQVWIPKTLSS
jgi:hypothetical protein